MVIKWICNIKLLLITTRHCTKKKSFIVIYTLKNRFKINIILHSYMGDKEDYNKLLHIGETKINEYINEFSPILF